MTGLSLNPAWDDPAELHRFTRRVSRSGQRLIAESVMVIEGMDCAACALPIEQALLRVPGVEQADVNSASGRARIRWDQSRTQASVLAATIEALGYRACPALSLKAEGERQAERRRELWRLFVAGFCMMQVMMYAAPAYYAGPGEISADIARLLQWASWLLCIPVMLFAAGPFLRGAWGDLRRGRVGMDVPVALGMVVTFVASTGATFDPGGMWGREVYFDSLSMFVFFLLCGRFLEQRARHATVGALEALMLRVPQTVERLGDDGSARRVPVSSLRAGDRLRVLPGEAFPADGCLLEGATQVDEALLTGESRPVQRRAGEPLLAGSINLASAALMRVQRSGRDTRYAQIVALMERACIERPALARLADRFAAPFLWGVLATAAVAAGAWWTIDPARSVWVAVAVLIVTCPCALSLATPSAMLAAAGALARRGVLAQRLDALEALAGAQLFVFDKTGTLTEDRLELRGVECFRGDEAGALRHARALACNSLHPVARAIATHADELSGAGDGAPRDAATGDMAAGGTELLAARELSGQGIEAEDAQGRVWRLGSAAFAGAPAALPAVPGSSACLSVDGRLVARFTLEERLRADAKSAIEQLRAEGIETMLLSGDQPAATKRIALALGLDGCHAAASPEDKLAVVRAAQAAGRRVAVIGDGINDAPVLARADVSIAMGQGAALARSKSDLALMSGRIADVLFARRLALRMLRVVRQNLAWAVLYNAACVPLAVLGLLPPWLAGLGMAASSLVVVLNAQRLRSGAEPPNASAVRCPDGSPSPLLREGSPAR